MSKQRLVVIGNGMAGARAVEEIIARGGKALFDIVMFGDEPYGNYNRILLSNVMNGSQDATEIFLNSLPWYEENGIRLHAGIKALSIDRVGRHVFGTCGIVEPYDKLIIATGSRPFLPPIKGMLDEADRLRPGIFGFRTLDDCSAIVAEAAKSKKAAVLGGGLLGLEAARGLLNHGCEVHVVHLASNLMNVQLDTPAAGILRASMEAMGVHVHLGASTTEVLWEDGRVSGLAFKDGTTLPCDMLVVSAGIKPNAELATRCGLTVERAIVVDNHMRSPDDFDVYVVGECAQHRGMVYGLVAPLWDQAKVLAQHITGKDATASYHGSKLATKLKVMGVELASMGITEATDEDEVVQFSEPKRGTYKKLIIRKGRLAGAIMLGDLGKVAYLTQAFDKNTPLPDDRLSLLFDIGAPAKKVTFDEMPEEAQVCNCNGVSKGAIGECVKLGKRTPKSVMTATRAGMGCGSCKGQVADLVEWFCGGEVDDDPTLHYYVPCIPLNKQELIAAVREQGLRSVSSVFAALSINGHEDAGSKPALASLLSVVWKGEYVDERDARFINDRVHGNIQKDGTFSVVPEIPGGVCSSADLRRIADVADKYAVPLIKLTGGQRIDLVGVAKDDLPAVWADLGMPAGSAWGKSYRTCKSCIGEDYCRFGLGDSMGLAASIEKRFRGLDSPGKLKLATAGCPRNCSEALVKDVGAVAVEGGKWELYVGGAAGSHIRKGDLLCVVDSHEKVLLLSGRFIQYYREQAKYKERTYAFVERIGIAKIRAIIVDDSEGLAAELDRAMQESVDAAYDPWLERDRPATANQFRYALPVVG